jgi:hypothetical protein
MPPPGRPNIARCSWPWCRTTTIRMTVDSIGPTITRTRFPGPSARSRAHERHRNKARSDERTGGHARSSVRSVWSCALRIASAAAGLVSPGGGPGHRRSCRGAESGRSHP